MEKIAVVTGSNRGIGLQICKDLAENHGFDVVLCSRSLEKGKIAAEKISSPVTVMELDVSNEDSISRFSHTFRERFDHLDVLINNAAILPNSKSTLNAPMEEIRSTIDTNVYGPLMLSRALYEDLRKSKSGKIINISSGMGALDDLSGDHAAYRLSKVALNGLTIMMAKELRNDGISVNAVCPGWVQTDMGGSGASRTVVKGAETPVWLATESNIPTGRFLRDKRAISW